MSQTNSERPSIEAQMLARVPASIETIAAGLRRMAERMEYIAARARSQDRSTLPGLTREVIHEVTWGVANLNIETPLMWLEQADMARDAEAQVDADALTVPALPGPDQQGSNP